METSLAPSPIARVSVSPASMAFGAGSASAPRNVPDVEAFPDHIACASSTRSELVLPVRNGAGKLLGVLDIDSDTPAAFTQADEDWLVPLLADVFRHAE